MVNIRTDAERRRLLQERLSRIMWSLYEAAEPCEVCGEFRIPGEGGYHTECDNLKSRACVGGVNIFARDGYRCKRCGADWTCDLTLDHIVPRSKGGTDDADNLQTLCQRCNSKKGTR